MVYIKEHTAPNDNVGRDGCEYSNYNNKNYYNYTKNYENNSNDNIIK